METAEERVLLWAKEGKELELPAWEDLPSIPLYMDQVIFYLRDSLRLFQQDEETSLLTSSMINNYVKSGLLSHPEKKKYGREHLSALMAVCMLKQVLSIQDIKTLFGNEDPDPTLYELFREVHTSCVRETCRTLEKNCRTESGLKLEAMRLAAEANAKRAAAARILSEIAREDAEKQKAEKKKQP